METSLLARKRRDESVLILVLVLYVAKISYFVARLFPFFTVLQLFFLNMFLVSINDPQICKAIDF